MKPCDKFLDAILTLDELSTDYRVKLDPNNALQFVAKAEEYNNFTKEDLKRLIETVNATIPPMDYGPKNPNTGRPFHWFEIGNEGSRVIYAVFPETYWPNYDKAALNVLMKQLALLAHADEMDDYSETGMYRFRFWWD